MNPLHSSDDEMLSYLLDSANHGDERVLAWFRRYCKHGITEGLAKDLNRVLQQFELVAHFGFDWKSKSLIPNFQIPVGVERAGDDFRIAFIFSSLLSDGELQRLRRCENRKCRKYHVRDGRAKWCSDGCGSGKRQRDKRKRDGNRGALL